MAGLNVNELRHLLRTGSTLRFTHKSCHRIVITPEGRHLDVDGRSYGAFTHSRYVTQFERTETGSVETGNLVIEWKAR